MISGFRKVIKPAVDTVVAFVFVYSSRLSHADSYFCHFQNTAPLSEVNSSSRRKYNAVFEEPDAQFPDPTWATFDCCSRPTVHSIFVERPTSMTREQLHQLHQF
jgi:hypothetical protein